MCGIVGYYGERQVKNEDLLDIALDNIHRGNDGIGFLNSMSSKYKVYKLLYTLKEIKERQLDSERIRVFKRIGSFGMEVKDLDTYNKRQEKFVKSVNEILNQKTNLLFVHHRKASVGEALKKNLHPFKIKDKYFIHNGTVPDIIPLKRYLTAFKEFKFNSDTDTEVMATIYSELSDIHGDDLDTIYNKFSNIFSPFGVFIIFDKDRFIIFMDGARELWMYKLKSGYLFVSEPTKTVSNFEKLYLINTNILDSKNIDLKDMIDYTTNAKEFLELWKRGKEIDNIRKIKCDYCDEEKVCLRLDNSLSKAFSGLKDKCFQCGVLGKKEEKTRSNYYNGVRYTW